MLTKLHYATVQTLVKALKPILREELIASEVKKCQVLTDKLTQERVENLRKEISIRKEKELESFKEKCSKLEEQLKVLLELKEKCKFLEGELESKNLEVKKHRDLLITQKNKNLDEIDQLKTKYKELQDQSYQLDGNRNACTEKNKDTHSVYGELLFDYGYKRVYASDARVISNRENLPVWEKQRLYNAARAKVIAKSKQKDDQFGYPGIITVYETAGSEKDGTENRRGVLDGQHRLGSLKFLIESGHWNEGQPILTEVYNVESEKEVAQLFKEINKSQPVKEMDIPGRADEKIVKVINETCINLQKAFPQMFSVSQRCRIPHVNVDNLRQELYDNPKLIQMISTFECNSGADDRNASLEQIEMLTEFILKQNEKLEERSDVEWENYRISHIHLKNGSEDLWKKALAKSKQNSFFIGLDKEWFLI